MCFSLEASVGAAALLTVVGYATIKKTNSKKQLLLASIPLIFAIQQYAEGLVWYTLQNQLQDSILHDIGKYSFLFAAYVLWPVWLPWSLYALEDGGSKKKILLYFVIAGVFLSILNIFLMPGNTIYAQIVDNSIQYNGGTPSPLAFVTLRFFYISIILIPTIVSSFKNIWIFGVLLAIFYLFAEFVYFTTFTSVWCFFAAICSIVLYKVIKDNTEI